MQLQGDLVPFLALSVVVRNADPGGDKLCVLARDLVQQPLYLHETGSCVELCSCQVLHPCCGKPGAHMKRMAAADL